MSDPDVEQRLAEAQKTIRALLDELAESNRGLVALTAELERKAEESKTMTQQLWQAAKLATVGELAASIAHELNNPLATVSLRLESLLEQAPGNDPRRRALEVIEQEVDRMGALVANLLQFSRRSGMQLSSVPICEEIDKTLDLVSSHLRNRQIAVERDFAADIPMIQADRQQVRQLFLNLFTNACDAMSGGGTLTIRVTHADRRVTVVIADTGIGIPPEALGRVMEPFFTTKPEGKGTGLGLPICNRIVQELQGQLEIRSEVGKGTTVRITIPVGNGAHVAYLAQDGEGSP